METTGFVCMETTELIRNFKGVPHVCMVLWEIDKLIRENQFSCISCRQVAKPVVRVYKKFFLVQNLNF